MTDPIAELLKHEYDTNDGIYYDSDWTSMAKLIRQQIGRELINHIDSMENTTGLGAGVDMVQALAFHDVIILIREVCQMEETE